MKNMKKGAEFIEHTEHTELNPTQDMLFEMANIYPEHTGLPFTVWISSQGEEHLSHGPRVKVAEGRRPQFIASVSVESPVRVVAGRLDHKQLRAVTQWIELNRETLLRHWRNEIDSKDAIDALKPIHG